jgi:hypothetical protein
MAKRNNMIKLIDLLENEDKGSISFNFPEGFKPAKRVPEGGAMCSNCAKWNHEKGECEGPYYIKWNGNGEIPTSPDKFVCVWWVPEKD